MKHAPTKFYAISLIVLVLALAGLAYYFSTHTIFSAYVEDNQKIDLTPQQIRSIKDIGQWEFLSISEEELVDTVRKGFFSDDHLVRIYHGRLSIGTNLQQLDEQLISVQGDTLHIVLPAITLLDDDFIDEANTRSFHETGRWSPAAREALYQKAKRQMKAHALTPENLKTAQEYGETEIKRLLQNMGFSEVDVKFEAASPQ